MKAFKKIILSIIRNFPLEIQVFINEIYTMKNNRLKEKAKTSLMKHFNPN